MIRKIVGAVITLLGIGTLTACGGGGASTPSTTSPGGGASSGAKTLPVYVSLFVPKTKAKTSNASGVAFPKAVRRPLYFPTSVNSVTMQQTESAGSAVTGAPITVLVIGGSNCSASTGGQTCTATLQGALGQDAWAIASYVTGNGSGTAVSVNTGTLTVIRGANNFLNLTLNPILASLAFVPVGDSTDTLTAVTLPLVLEAMDTAGATIVGPGTFVTAANVASPTTLTTSSSVHVALQTSAATSATVTLSTTADNDLAFFDYDGNLTAGLQTISASASGITTATFDLTLTLATGGLVVPANIALGEDLGTTTAPLSISEPGYGGSFTLSSSSCSGIVSFPSTATPGRRLRRRSRNSAAEPARFSFPTARIAVASPSNPRPWASS